MKLYKAFRRPTMLHFDNSGKYGTTFLECQIIYTNGVFRAYITDGYKFLNAGEICNSLKEAVTWGKTQVSK